MVRPQERGALFHQLDPLIDQTHHTDRRAAAAAAAAVPRGFAQQATNGGTGKFYEKGSVRIHYEDAGTGFPLLLLPGGGLNSTISFFTGNSPFNAIKEFKGEIARLRRTCATPPPSTGPVEVDRSWDPTPTTS